MARPDKAAAVAELTDKFRSSNAAVLTEYRGLTVAQLKTLRRSLGENAQYAVVKNTLTKIAANEAGITLDDQLFAGPTAVAFVTGDPVESAKGLRDFAKDNPNLVIKGGVFDGKALSADERVSARDRRIGHGQGAGRADDSPPQSSLVVPVHRHQLRGDPRDAARKRDLRT